jgi:hypothetical protein
MHVYTNNTSFAVYANCSSVYPYKSSVLPYAIDLLNGVISFERERKKNLVCNVPIIDRRNVLNSFFCLVTI